MNISALAIRRPVATVMLILMVAVVGISAMVRLPKDLLPKIDYPAALVFIQYPDASPFEVEAMVTRPLEQALATVENLDSIQSLTSEGQSLIFVQFQMEADMDFAVLNMREKISMASPFLPDEVSDPAVFKMDLSSLPIIQIYVSGDRSPQAIGSEIKNSIASYFERVKGVASVDAVGITEEEVAVRLSQEKLAGYGLSLTAVAQIIKGENINMPGGNISKGQTEVILRTVGQFRSPEDLKNVPVPLADRSVIRLSDLGSVTRQKKEASSVSRIDGKNAVSLFITKESDANTVAVSGEVAKTLKRLEKLYPDLDFTVGVDQADYINRSLSSVTSAALLGAALAILAVFLFLRNFRTTLVIAVSIPTSLLAAFALMHARGITLNLVTLCALTISVGMLVDNSIVMLENIFRVRQEASSAEEAALRGSREIYLAVIASTLTTVVVFLPIALSGGIAALMFKDFCFTMIIALLSSLAVSLTAVPMLCSRLLTRGLSMDYIRFGNRRYKYRIITRFTDFIEFLSQSYDRRIRQVLKRRGRFLLACAGIFCLSLSAVLPVGSELLPASDESAFTITAKVPYGTPLSEKDRLAGEIEEVVSRIPELRHFTVNIGLMTLFRSAEDITADVTLVSRGSRSRSTSQVVRELKRQLSSLPGAEISIQEASSIGMMMGDSDMTLVLKGKELGVLENIGDNLAKQLRELDSVADARLDLSEGKPEIRVIPDRNAASFYGVSAYQLADALGGAVTGRTVSKLKTGGDEIDIVLSLSDRYSDSAESMKQILVPGMTGQPVPAGQIASFEYGHSPSTISRLNQERAITLKIDAEGTDLGAAAREVLSVAESYPFPEGYRMETGGQQKEMEDAFGNLLLALIVAVALVYLLLAAQFESLLLPFIIMMSIPFAMSGAFFALFLTGTSLSMTSFLGLILLVGIVVNNAILLVEFISRGKEKMGRDEALVQAGRMRLRPILMTALTTCLGMLPISFGLGEGGETLAPMGISIIGGMAASTLVTLFLIPVLYSLIDDKRRARAEKKERKHQHIRGLEQQWYEEDHPR